MTIFSLLLSPLPQSTSLTFPFSLLHSLLHWDSPSAPSLFLPDALIPSCPPSRLPSPPPSLHCPSLFLRSFHLTFYALPSSLTPQFFFRLARYLLSLVLFLHTHSLAYLLSQISSLHFYFFCLSSYFRFTPTCPRTLPSLYSLPSCVLGWCRGNELRSLTR